MKRILVATVVYILLLLAIGFNSPTKAQQQTADYGFLVTSLATTSAGVVSGTSFAIPQGSATIITWTITEDGGAQSTLLEGSQDNTVWFTIDTNTDAAGGIRNYGFTSIKFVRVSQTSRTGGTNTLGTILTSRGQSISAGSGISSTFTADAGGSFSFTGRSRITSPSDGNILMTDNAGISFNQLMFGGITNAFPSIKRSATSLQIRLADDSGFADLAAAAINASGPIGMQAISLAGLGTPQNGTLLYCTDCLVNSAPCTGASTGALAKRVAAAWRCD